MRIVAGLVAFGLGAGPGLACAGAPTETEPLLLSAPAFVVGDTWVYDRTHEVAKKSFTQERTIQTVERVSSDSLLIGLKLDGSPADFEDHLVGLDLSQRHVVDGQTMTTDRMLSFPMKIGNTWEEDYIDPHQQGIQTSAHVQKTYKVIGWEDVTVPAGTFHALKIEANGKLIAQVSLPAIAASAAQTSSSGGTAISHAERARSGAITELTYRAVYYAPSVKTWVKTIYEQYNSDGVRVKRDTAELASFKAGGGGQSALPGTTAR